MIDLSELEINNFICNETSSFALAIIDIESSEIIYTNNSMNDFMLDVTSEKCYKSIYGQDSKCSWCGLKDNTSEPFEFEFFNEKKNKWYQVQNKPTKLKNGKIS
ncbi:MAG: hypothetical protein ACI9TV_002304 [Sulfurimonas sp.]|jgi:hypothetical protein|uniref:hypothetical protein n=1 Tax=Sulfurimonas sp. TaxID=2022749 RepID=UPI0039E524F2